MLESGKLMAFAATKRPEQARAFYEGTLGLRVLSDDPYAIALDANGTQLRIQKVADFEPLPFTTLGWQVADIAATVEELQDRGVTFQTFPGLGQDARGIWSAPSGAQVAWFRDPDENTLSLTQM
jgi:catechol 2,3-dioxygenase-like lactoylglutathione lyase family enzyme